MSLDDIEDIYELSPLQQGMLFHTIYDPPSRVYFEQESYPISEAIDVPAFVRAWHKVLERHPILRSSYHWEGLEKPVQVVHQHVQLPVDVLDWRSWSANEQEERLEAYLKSDREKGFDLLKAPLIRVTLIKRAENLLQFVLSYHHILLDGWSDRLIEDEVWTLYEAYSEGKALQLEPVRPYVDYIAWLQRQDIAKAEMFWRRVLAGFEVPTRFGIDRTARVKPAADLQQGEQSLRLSRQTTVALQSLARENRLTLNTIVQGAWAVIISRYGGDMDVVFGTVVSGRPAVLAGVESMVGLFINTLPLRTQILPDAFPLPWLKELQAQQLEAREYEYTPLVEIQRWSEVLPGVPLFESIVIFENYPISYPPQEGDDQAEWSFHRFEKTNYPLNLMVVPGARLDLKILFSQQRFDAAAITRMLGHLRTFLEGLAVDPERRVADIPLLSDGERRHVVVEWNATRTAYPCEATIPALFEAQVARTPEARAVVCHGQALSYQELNRRANRLAHHLRALGVRPEQGVGICMPRSLEMVIGLLAILKAGAAYVPLDPTYPAERLAYMVADAGLEMVLSQQGVRERLPPSPARIVWFETWSLAAGASEENLASTITPDSLAYVMYTSGSTGSPKGVMAMHRGAINRFAWMWQTYPFAPGEVCCARTSLSFVDSVWELFGPLLRGIPSVILADEQLKDLQQLVTTLAEYHVTRLVLVPSLLRTLLASEPKLGAKLPDLKYWVTSGEALTPELGAQFRARLPQRILLNLYGSSEVAGDVTCCDTRTVAALACMPIGRPISNMQTYIVDRQLQPVPVGVTGELLVGGVGLVRGYYQRPELTAEKFILNPFESSHAPRLYKTGDFARYLPDGTIEFMGRQDQQVKVRGFRIELGEVEAVLAQHPGVQQAVVVAREEELGEQRLVAYVVRNAAYEGAQVRDTASAPNANIETDSGQPRSVHVDNPLRHMHLQALGPELRRFLQAKLPDYMVPATFVMLESLPLTPTGKLDRMALPTPSQRGSEPKKTYIAPRTPIEQVLVKMYADVLALERVGINDNFFTDLGGHSLLATQLVSRIRDNFRIELPLQAVFNKPTVGELVQELLGNPLQRLRLTRIAEILLTLTESSED